MKLDHHLSGRYDQVSSGTSYPVVYFPVRGKNTGGNPVLSNSSRACKHSERHSDTYLYFRRKDLVPKTRKQEELVEIFGPAAYAAGQ